eukprot:COSAG04_NODE_2468_length_4076_cov_2.450339_2_plen_59_part_00
MSSTSALSPRSLRQLIASLPTVYRHQHDLSLGEQLQQQAPALHPPRHARVRRAHRFPL